MAAQVDQLKLAGQEQTGGVEHGTREERGKRDTRDFYNRDPGNSIRPTGMCYWVKSSSFTIILL